MEDGEDDREKDERAGDAVQQYGVQAARPQRSRGRLVVGARGDLRGPTAAGGGALQDGQLHGAELGGECVVGVQEKLWDDVEPRALCRADQSHRMPKLSRQCEGVQLAAARLHLIGHIQQHERRQADGEDGRGKHELPVQVGGVEDKQNAVGLGDARHLAGQHFDRDARVLGVRGERVDSGQVDERQVVAPDGLHSARVVLHGYAGIVGHLLTHPGQSIEKGGLAGVRRADQCDGSKARFGAGRRDRRLLDGLQNRGVATHAAAPGASFRKMWRAVSLRRPTSTPSMR